MLAYLRLGLSTSFLPVCLQLNILATYPAHLNILDLITLTINFLSLLLGAQILASGYSFGIPLAWIPPLI
jgi:hypothetical protein